MSAYNALKKMACARAPLAAVRARPNTTHFEGFNSNESRKIAFNWNSAIGCILFPLPLHRASQSRIAEPAYSLGPSRPTLDGAGH